MKQHSMLSNETKCDAEMQGSKHLLIECWKDEPWSITPLAIINVTGVQEEDTKLMHQQYLIHMQSNTPLNNVYRKSNLELHFLV